MTNKLEDLSKEDLILVIANMHDTIQSWDGGWGFNQKDSEVLINVGNLCTGHCVKIHGHEWPALSNIIS